MNKRGLFVVAILVLAAIGVWGLTSQKEAPSHSKPASHHTVRDDLGHYFSDAGTAGTMVIRQSDGMTTVVNEHRSKQAYLPSSTFKVPHSLIALQEKAVSGPDEIMQGPHAQLMINGKSFLPPICEGDITFRQAFQNSCATIYQEIARKIPQQTYQRYVDTMHYGNMDISSVSTDKFWLYGDLAITPAQQIDFLQKLYEGTLPFSKTTMDATKSMMFVEGYAGSKIYGKTGWVFSQEPQVGWWVGWVEKEGRPTFFALNVDLLKADQASARMLIAKAILKELHIVE